MMRKTRVIMNNLPKEPVTHVKHRRRKYFWPIIIGSLFISFFLLVSFYYMYLLRSIDDTTISADITKLEKIFDRIHETCVIRKFDREKNSINFLNTKSFAGTKVGSMTLEFPEKWEGPYLVKEPVIQNKPYQIALTKNGYYIMPGDGVKLPNGKVIGKDIIINAQTDIEALIKNPDGLLGKNNQPLAAAVKTVREPFDLLVPKNVFAFNGITA
jgi:hypothetical protein